MKKLNKQKKIGKNITEKQIKALNELFFNSSWDGSIEDLEPLLKAFDLELIMKLNDGEGIYKFI